ncbi:hypothetical protein LJC59_06880 [Desulfovibrio sp. OttesenSCG-928-A18]|nr:hypothetical protein [Desulfovibrio sp. OttesenSCG-928-A18]
MSSTSCLSRKTRCALMVAAAIAEESNETEKAALMYALLPVSDAPGRPDRLTVLRRGKLLRLAGSAGGYNECILRSHLGEERFQRFLTDPEAFCEGLLNDFYREHLASILSGAEQERLCGALLQAVASGEYSKEEWARRGFRPEWFAVLRPLMSREQNERLQEALEQLNFKPHEAAS